MEGLLWYRKAVQFVLATVEDAIAQGIGFSKVVSMGNKVDMDENDVLELVSR